MSCSRKDFVGFADATANFYWECRRLKTSIKKEASEMADNRIVRVPENPKPDRTPRGWKANKGGNFFLKGSVHGQRYKCKFCGKESLGMGDPRRMHWSHCHLYPPKQPHEDLGKGSLVHVSIPWPGGSQDAIVTVTSVQYGSVYFEYHLGSGFKVVGSAAVEDVVRSEHTGEYHIGGSGEDVRHIPIGGI